MTKQPTDRELLFRLLATAWDPLGLKPRDLLPWSIMAQLAEAHDVGPMLYAAVRKSRLPIPDKAGETLRQMYYQAATTNTYHLQDLFLIVKALSSMNTPILLLKGAALVETLYDNIAPRPMADVDLVLPPQQLPACQEAIVGLGYLSTAVEVTPGSDVAYRNELALSPQEPFHTYVELHWHLLDVPYYIRKVPMDWFWENTETVEIAGHAVQVLNPEANLLYLPAHLALHHRFHGLRWFVDLALLVHKCQETLDWDTVTGKAQEFELLLVLRETLDRLHGYWPSLPLEEPRRRLHALEPTPFEARLFRLLTTEPRSPLLDFYTDLVCLPGWRARMRFALLNLFPQRAYMAQRYGAKSAWQLPCWYLYRLGDGAVKLGRTLPQVLRLR